MKRPTKLFPLLLFVAIFAAVLVGSALLRLTTFGEGAGQSAQSPDKKFTARAISMTRKRILGTPEYYYEFSVETGSSQILQRIEVNPPGGISMDWRTNGKIAWSPDNSFVTFSFNSFVNW